VEHFLEDALCERLVAIHRRHGSAHAHTDNGLYVPSVRNEDPEGHVLVQRVVERIREVIEGRFQQRIHCDLSLLCAITPGGFRHRLHADNATVVCPRHGADAEQLVRIGCSCADANVVPNHTPWRRYSALLYLSGDQAGGHIIFGAGPNAHGRRYRTEIKPRRGLLVLSPSDEHHFHETTAVSAGVRYSMSTWYTDDPAHIGRDWQE
jgi:hypothetical protein